MNATTERALQHLGFVELDDLAVEDRLSGVRSFAFALAGGLAVAALVALWLFR